MSTINVNLNTNATIPFRAYGTKSGNVAHGVLATKADGSRYFSKYGVPVEPKVIGGALPSSCEVLGTTFTGDVGTTDKGRKKVTFSGDVNVDGVVKAFRLTISAKVGDDGKVESYNVSGSINGKRGSGAGRKAVSAL